MSLCESEEARMTSPSSPLLPCQPSPASPATTMTNLSGDGTSPRLVLAHRGEPLGPLTLFTWITVNATDGVKVQPHHSER